tara:strand:- start:324 stop:527 length:204 start_codon:yes stop_codon:yes gene_type:complete
MSAQFKLDQNSSPDQDKEKSKNKISKRPNIDHLLRKISLERKKEKTNSLFMLAVGIISIGLFSFSFM